MSSPAGSSHRRWSGITALALALILPSGAAAPLRADAAADDRIKLRIENKLNGLVSVHLEEFGIQVSDGVVRITGSVASVGEKATIERVIGGLSGIARLDNQLTVRTVDRPEAAMADDVKRLLERRPRFRRNPIQVTVSGSVVSLAGEVERAIDRLDAEEIASGIAGVTAVENGIRVIAREPVPVEDLRRKVQGAIENPLTFGVIRRLEVTVEEGGIVTLRGVAGREADRTQAARLALGVIGVTTVRNLIEVAGP